MTLDEVAIHYGISGSTWSYAETEGKNISSKILDALSKVIPPAGKGPARVSWLLTGEGKMIGEIGLFGSDTARILGQVEGPPPPPDPIERHRWVAHQIAENGLKDRGLFSEATAAQKYLLVTHLARALAADADPEALQRELNDFLDVIEAACRKAG